MTKLRAFTLVELLVVISIIAMLMAVLMPALAAVQKRAKAILCQSRLKQWGLYYVMYIDDVTDGFFPDSDSAASMASEWMSILNYYKGEPEKLFFCPIAVLKGPSKDGGTFTAYSAGGEPFGSYGINRWVYNTPPGTENSSTWRLQYRWGTPRVKGPYRVPLLMDSMHDGTQPLVDAAGTPEPPSFEEARDWTSPGKQIKRVCMPRHPRATINAVFFDWSVRSVGLKELWTLKWHRQFDTTNEWTIAGGATREKWQAHGDGWMRDFKDY